MAALPKPVPVPVSASEGLDPSAAEERDVHAVYESIAGHFARTRFKPWPLIEKFLSTIPPGSIGLDSGAGNGKYLPSVAAAGAWAVALDRSRGLLDIARGQLPECVGGAECVRADLCDVPWRPGMFDFAISVAAIHHLSTPDRRAAAVAALLRTLRLSAPGGGDAPARFFIYVWAYEQGPNSRRKMGSLADAVAAEAAAGAGSSEGAQAPREKERVQDVLVPWVLTPPQLKKAKGTGGKAGAAKGGKGVDASRRAARGEEEGAEEKVAPSPVPEPAPAAATTETERPPAEAPGPDEPQVFHRYYHLFVKDELRDLVERAAREDAFAVRGDSSDDVIEGGVAKGVGGGKWMRIVAEGWEADNWWIEGEVGL